VFEVPAKKKRKERLNQIKDSQMMKQSQLSNLTLNESKHKFFADLFDKQLQKKTNYWQRMSYMERLILIDLIGTFFAVAGLLVEMISARIQYKASVERTPFVHPVLGAGKLETLQPNRNMSMFNFLQASSSFATLLSLICLILSYNFEVNSLIERNLVKNTCRPV
jgi:hypothetical protein